MSRPFSRHLPDELQNRLSQLWAISVSANAAARRKPDLSTPPPAKGVKP